MMKVVRNIKREMGNFSYFKGRDQEREIWEVRKFRQIEDL